MAVAVSTIVAGVRVMSGLRNSRLFSDDQIADLLTDAVKELEDIFIQSYQHWFRSRYTFTLAGGLDDYSIDLAEAVPTFQMAQLLTRNPGPNRETIPLLGSIANVNAGSSTLQGLGAGYIGRRYFIDGDSFQVLPPESAAGDYELLYTPQSPGLELGVDVDPTPYTRSIVPVYSSDNLLVSGPFAIFTIANAAFTAADVGGTVNIAGAANPGNDASRNIILIISPTSCRCDGTDAVTETFILPATESVTRLSIVSAARTLSVNDAVFDQSYVGGTIKIRGAVQPDNDGDWTIDTVVDSHTVTLAGTATLVDESFGSDVTLTLTHPNYLDHLPVVLTPWELFLKVHASVAIRTSRQQDAADLSRKLERQRARAQSAAKTRSEGVNQPPVTRPRWGAGYGGGGFTGPA